MIERNGGTTGRQEIEPLPGLLGRDPRMLEVFRRTRIAATTDLPVLLVGETGTGKELVARALHMLSGPPVRPFVVVNCAAVPENLAEGEFFGWERGAFSGAVARRTGKLELADGGTLSLDEACSLSVALQAKLLRALEYGEFERVGGAQTIRSRFRLVTTVSEPVERLLAAGRWRADFAARADGLTIGLPSLRDRAGDVALLTDAFLTQATAGRDRKQLDDGALASLVRYSWPRNVRELKALVGRLAVMVEGPTIGADDVILHLPGLAGELEGRARIDAVLAAEEGDVGRAAKALGMGRSTLYRRLREYAEGGARPLADPSQWDGGRLSGTSVVPKAESDVMS